jgi:hypothetical protein
MEKNCLYCGAHFTTKRNNKKYCCDNCKQMAYFKRNGLVLSKTPELAGVKYNLPATKINQNVKYVSEKPVVKDESGKTVKYVSPPLMVKDVAQSSRNSVKSASEVAHTNEAIELVINRFMEKMEERITKKLENVKQELAVKYDGQTVKPDFTDQGNRKQVCHPKALDRFTGSVPGSMVKITTRNPAAIETVKYVPEPETVKDDQENQKTDFTANGTAGAVSSNTPVTGNEEPAISIFPEIQPVEQSLKDEGSSEENEGNNSDPEEQTEIETEEMDLLVLEPSEEEPEESEESEEREEGAVLVTAEKAEWKRVPNPKALRIPEPEKQLQDIHFKQGAKKVVPVLKTDSEPEYKWADPKIFKRIEKYHQFESKESLFRDPYRHWNHQNVQSVNWINVRLRCLIESMLKLSNYSRIDTKTLFCIADAFSRLMKSDAYKTLPGNYPYKELIEGLCMKLNVLAGQNADSETIKFVLPLERKTMLIALRHEMVKHTPSMKFSEMDFPETINEYLIKAENSKDKDDDEEDDDEKKKTSMKPEWKQHFEAFKRQKRMEEASLKRSA